VASGDGVLAELLAPRARSIVCVDAGTRVVDAARQRLRSFANVEVKVGDMHALDFPVASFDLVLLMHALPYSEKPHLAIAEAARVLRSGGRLIAATLGRHAHRTSVEPFEHRNLGFTVEELHGFARAAKLDVIACERLSRERRPPHFEVLSLLARKP
jgi:ubiquinone/menaquinone biosynthesis C-methylase UbiE